MVKETTISFKAAKAFAGELDAHDPQVRQAIETLVNAGFKFEHDLVYLTYQSGEGAFVNGPAVKVVT